MFAMGITRQRERDGNASQSRKAEREAYERKLQRELSRELAKQDKADAEEESGAKAAGSFYDVCKAENETGSSKPKGKSQAAAYRELKKNNSNPELKPSK